MKKYILILLLFSISTIAQIALPNKTVGSVVKATEWNNAITRLTSVESAVAGGYEITDTYNDTTLTTVAVWTILGMRTTDSVLVVNLPEITPTSRHNFVSVAKRGNYPVYIYPSNSTQPIGADTVAIIINDFEGLTLASHYTNGSTHWHITQDSRSKAVGEVFAEISTPQPTTVTNDTVYYYMNGIFDNKYTLNFGIVDDTLTYTGTKDSVRIFIEYSGDVTSNTLKTPIIFRVMQNDTAITGSRRHSWVQEANGIGGVSGSFTTILRTNDKFHFEVASSKNAIITVIDFSTHLHDTRR